MKKTFVYLCKNGDNEELRYSLRSVEKFYPESEVWVIGGKPSWYQGNFIKIKETRDAFKNVKSALAETINNPMIPNEFIVMNDDFFFVRYVENIKTYVSGRLKDRVDINMVYGIKSSYVMRLAQLYRHCKRFRNPPLDFDLHVPMPVDKRLLEDVVRDSVMWRSNYGNRFVSDDQIEVIKDVKVYERPEHQFRSYDYSNLELPFLSTNNDSFERVYNDVLKGMFTSPSKYEISNDT